MSRHTEEPIARGAFVHFPNGDREYWLTGHEFTVGMSVQHNGDEWIVAEVRPLANGAMNVTVREHEGAQEEREGSLARDQEAWNLPRPVPDPVGGVWTVNEPQVSAHMLPIDDPEPA